MLPGSKTGLMEFAQVCVERGETIVLPDPGYPDYRSAVALAGARHAPLPLLDDGAARLGRRAGRRRPRSISTIRRTRSPRARRTGVFEEAIEWAQRAGAWVLHDFAYGDLVFDGRKPASFLAVDGAREVGFELFSMSKSYGMAGWRLGFAVGNAEIVARIEDLQNHQFAGIFMPVQEAGIAALTGPQDSVEERRALYEARRDRAVAALAGCEPRGEGTFFVWFRLPDGLTCERAARGAPRRGRAGRGLRRARPRLGAPLARDRRTSSSTSGSSGCALRSRPVAAGCSALGSRPRASELARARRASSSSSETAARATPSSHTLKRTCGSSPK